MRKLLPWLLVPAYYLWLRTMRVRFYGYDAFSDPVVYLFWHNALFPLIFTHRRRGVVVLVSTHQDGELVAGVLRIFGFGLARGSATRDGSKAVRSVVEGVKRGRSVAITPDGPRGPRYEFKDGAWRLAKGLRVPVLYVGVAYSSYWQLDSWDGFMIPKPFSRCVVYLEEERDTGISAGEAGKRLSEVSEKAKAMLAGKLPEPMCESLEIRKNNPL
ncbi:MAG: lysophospholipid acyltransferase family protein [candidate division WOR-3 bacterium]